MSREYSETNVETDPSLIPLGGQGGSSAGVLLGIPTVGSLTSIGGQPGPVIALSAGAANKGLAVQVVAAANTITFSVSGVTTAVQESGGQVLDFGAVANGELLQRSGTAIIGVAGPPPSGPAGGDLSGTYPNPSVVDDSHAHTGTTVSAIGNVSIAAGIDAVKIADGSVTNAEFQFINTLTSNAQTQIDGKQPLDSDLTTIAGLTATTDNFMQSKSSAWASRTVAQVKTDLGLTGTNSGDQTSIVGITGTTAQFNTALTDGDFATGGGTATGTNTGDQSLAGLQPLDTTLTALAAYSANGLLTQTAADTFVGRSVAVHADANLTIVDGNGVLGNPTLNTAQGIKTTSSPSFAGLSVALNQNAATFFTVLNTTNGTSARSYYVAESSGSRVVSTQAVSPGFTLVPDWADAGILYSNCASFQLINDSASGSIRFKIGGIDATVEKVRILSTGNVKIAGTAARATTEGTNHLDIFNGTAPVGTLANGISLYSTAGELRVMDAAGNPTLLSPHARDGYWIFESRSGQTGKMFRVQMERMMRALDVMMGGGFIEELGEA